MPPGWCQGFAFERARQNSNAPAKAGALADRALEVALPRIHAGGSEAAILAAMQGAVLSAGGDYPGNPFIIGSGEGSLLCRYYSGRRCLDASDQLTLEWSGTWRLYHAARMMTVVIGDPRDEHLPMFDAAREALLRCEEQLRPGRCFGDVFRAHAEALDTAGFGAHRMNACGYSLGARYAPSWMDTFMFYEGNPEPILSGMVLFVHIILMDSDSGSAMCLGRTSVTTEDGPEPINGEENPVDTALRAGPLAAPASRDTVASLLGISTGLDEGVSHADRWSGTRVDLGFGASWVRCCRLRGAGDAGALWYWRGCSRGGN